MLRSIHPLHFLLTLLSGWIDRRQLDAIEYLKAENRLLKERLVGRRLRFTDAERRRLARRAYALGRRALSELDTLVTPDTLMRWYRALVAQKRYTRIQGALGNLGHHVGRGTIASVLHLRNDSFGQ